MKAWALVGYTLLLQMSVGAFLLYMAVRSAFPRESEPNGIRRLADRVLVPVAVTLVLGVAISFLHLGRPLAAYRAITNISSSWLSREILFTVLYGAFGLLYLVFAHKDRQSPTGRTTLAGWAAAAAGLLLVGSMSQIYRLEAVPSWNTLTTPVFFLSTALLLGSLMFWTSLLSRPESRGRDGEVGSGADTIRKVVRMTAIASILLFGIQVIATFAGMSHLVSLGGSVATSLALVMPTVNTVMTLYLSLGFVTICILAGLVYREALPGGSWSALRWTTALSFILMTAAELLNRFLFYSAPIRLGLS